MVENSKKSEPVDLKELVLESLDDIKAVDVVCIDVRNKTELTDYMIVVSGTSNRHVKSIANNVVVDAKAAGFMPLGIEGLDEGGSLKKIQIYPKKSKSMNLAFDVTPAKYVTGLITEKGICEASTEGLKGLFK